MVLVIVVNLPSQMRKIIRGKFWKRIILSDCINCYYSLESLLLCNKTSEGPGFSKTEIQTLDTQILKLEEGECEQFQNDGFRCVEHYQCIGNDVRLITDGNSQTR